MRLCIDIGNSRIKWGWSDAPGVVEAAGNCEQTSEMFAILEHHAAPTEILLADVRGGQPARDILTHAQKRTWPEPVAVATRAGFGQLNVGYRQPELLGVDRFLCLVAVLGDSPAVVVSAGTALTIDGISAQGEHKGGVIMPGQRAALDALTRAAPVLHGRADLSHAVLSPWGCDTSEALGNGVLYAWVGGAERVISDMRQRLGADCRVVLTGGDGLSLKKWLRIEARYDEHLVLRGMTHL